MLILTLNCNKGNCKSGNSIGNLILNHDPDIICFQEYNHIVAQQLVPYKLENQYIFINSAISQGWSGNVIYTKFPVLKSTFIEIEGKSRKVPIITVLSSNGPVTIANIHLDPGRSTINAQLRNKQLSSIFSFSENVNIIVGDFNMSINEIAWPPKGWLGSELVGTFDSSNKCNTGAGNFNHPFDRCLYRGLNLDNTQLIGNINPVSDHYGLLLTFSFNKIPIPIGKQYFISMKFDQLNMLYPYLSSTWIMGIDDHFLPQPIQI